ncbi:hypothetical protein MTO98_23925 [Mucilaginibacter sp. SMC90]|uniref:hypothetical protein n=1 Tax=Mucilaginibacter sp. SMC90 TaxID=2929803 RepID=UPI001FB2ECC0|nr:hypothetical protein [Mucilaginibacter sp. SMC90]UOE47460.1 hypothetical protein MTO98_23925 [Mucilaginibacter sp. SMC90]
MKLILPILLLTILSMKASSQETKPDSSAIIARNAMSTYAYIQVEGKLLSKKLKVQVDFGDTPEQLKMGKEYSEKLTGKKSYAAILNFMVQSKFELVQTLEYSETYSGTGGTTGIVFIMKKNIPL